MLESYEANTAKTYATVGLVFYGLSTFLWLIIGAATAWVLSWATISWEGPWYGPWDEPLVWEWGTRPIIPWFIFAAVAVGFLISLAATAWAYIHYKKINEGNYADARTSSLILGIFGLVPLLGSFIGGIFFLLAYWKLGEVLKGPRAPIYHHTPSYAAHRFCIQCGRAVDPDTKFCAHCGAQLPE